MQKFLTAACIACILFACNSKKKFTPVYNVAPEYERFVQMFIHEAELRGHHITITNLIIKNDNTIAYTHCGECNSKSPDPNVQKIISINSNLLCWNNDTELQTLIFHELGHCVLGRDHDNSLLKNGDPKSIMTENNLGIYSPCVYPIGGTPCDNSFKRSYYIDELFIASTPAPYWAG